MSQLTPERLYALLPAFHRLRDAGQGEPLRTLLAVIETELERVESDVAGLYENWFIETCDEWVVPYIGDLLGVRPIRPIPSAGVSTRAYVANTIAYRRRKGTALVLEQLANDVTGWPAHVVESFKTLTTTQHVNHIRRIPTATAGLRDAAAAEWADGAFDTFSHTADMRSAARGGRHAVAHIALYLWRLRSYRMGAGNPGKAVNAGVPGSPAGAGDPGDEAADVVSARRDPAGIWRVHPVGHDAPLFNIPRTETLISQASAEADMPGPLRALALNADLDRLRHGVTDPPARFMTDDDPVLRVFVRLAGASAPMEVPRDAMYLCHLPSDTAALPGQPLMPVPALAMAIDPQRGRLAFREGLPVEEVWTQHSYGFAGDLGGGPYDRTAALRSIGLALAGSAAAAGDDRVFNDPEVWQVGVSHLVEDDGRGLLFPSLRDAVLAWNAVAAGRTGVIVLMDSLSDVDVPGAPALPLEIQVGERSRLLIVAGGWPREPVPGDAAASGDPGGSLARRAGTVDASRVRAHVIADVIVRGTAPAGTSDGGACVIHGVLLEGRLEVAAGNLGQLVVSHCTVAQGLDEMVASANLMVANGNDRLELRIDRSICPGIDVPGPIRGLRVVDSLVGSGQLNAPRTPVDVLRSTFFGPVTVQSISASDCLFAEGVQAARRQTGCVRFSYVPAGSTAPRRYRCQPETEVATRLAALQDAAKAHGTVPTAVALAAVRAEVRASLRPLFVSREWGDPGFGQLELRCALALRTGAESGAEMGAFEFLHQPQREANLRGALDEYLRFGLEASLIYVT